MVIQQQNRRMDFAITANNSRLSSFPSLFKHFGFSSPYLTADFNDNGKNNDHLKNTPWEFQMVFWKKDLAKMIGMSIRTIERMMKLGGEIPPPDMHNKNHPGWYRQTIIKWLGDWPNGDKNT
jgi:hypothetical protein